MVLVVHTPNPAQFVGGGLVINVAHQGVAGVGGDRQNLAFFKQGNGLLEQARLGVFGMNFK